MKTKEGEQVGAGDAEEAARLNSGLTPTRLSYDDMRFTMVTLYPKPTLASKDPKSSEMHWLFRLDRVSWIQRFGALLRLRTYHSPILDRCDGERTKTQLSLVKLDAGHILDF